MKLVKTSVQLSPESVKWLKEFAEQHNLTTSKVIRLVLEHAEKLEWENEYVGYRIEHIWA